jgi:hypothetical protein
MGERMNQYRGRRIIRQVEVVERHADGTATVKALNGPLAGAVYTVNAETLR